MNIIFPKDANNLIIKIKELNKNKEYKEMFDLRNKILENARIINDIDRHIFDIFIYSLFINKEFDRVVSFTEELKKHDIENYTAYFYTLAYLISINDLYYARNILRKINLFKDPEIVDCVIEDESMYGKIFALPNIILEEKGPLLIVKNFLEELLVEDQKIKIDSNYIMERWFDTINLIYEYPSTTTVVNRFLEVVKLIYEIE